MSLPNDNAANAPAATPVQDERMGGYILVNAFEEMVRDAVGQMQPRMDMCNCPKCFCDACALALNNLPPHYVTTRKGEVLSKTTRLDVGNYADFSILAAKALQQVKETPKH